jgi:DNA processing protein
MLAIVGARKATPYGLSCARRFGRRAAQLGLTVVSGGAIGCDQAAHLGALEAKGRCVVVLGCGADVVYPSKAGPLFEEVVNGGGAVTSEAPWGSAPTRWAFRNRNRVIAALGQATLIVEAGLPSGTFSTADAALETGSELLVVPGSIDSPQSQGSNRLLLQGATPVIDIDSFDDAMRGIFGHGLPRGPWHAAESAGIDLGGEQERAIYQACLARPCHAEELLDSCEGDLLKVIRVLAALELEGRMMRMRDGRYAAIALQ